MKRVRTFKQRALRVLEEQLARYAACGTDHELSSAYLAVNDAIEEVKALLEPDPAPDALLVFLHDRAWLALGPQEYWYWAPTADKAFGFSSVSEARRTAHAVVLERVGQGARFGIVRRDLTHGRTPEPTFTVP